MNPQERLSNYLGVLSKAQGLIDSGTTWVASGSEQGQKHFVVVPFSVKQILFNTGIGNREELNAILDSAGIKHSFDKKTFKSGENKDVDTEIEVLELLEATGEKEPPAPGSRPGSELSVEELFLLTLCAECNEHFSAKNEIMKIEEAVFGIKNTLSIADDFMPHGIMGMVEGAFPSDPAEFVELNQFSGGGDVFILMKESEDGFAGFYAIVPGFRPSSGALTFGDLLGRLKTAIEELSRKPFFGEFEFSRLLKTLIFQLDFKKQRVLKGPMLQSANLKLLESRGLLEERDGTHQLKQTVESSELKKMKVKADSSVLDSVREWHRTVITL